jgi:hypothetical protein
MRGAPERLMTFGAPSVITTIMGQTQQLLNLLNKGELYTT